MTTDVVVVGIFECVSSAGDPSPFHATSSYEGIKPSSTLFVAAGACCVCLSGSPSWPQVLFPCVLFTLSCIVAACAFLFMVDEPHILAATCVGVGVAVYTRGAYMMCNSGHTHYGEN